MQREEEIGGPSSGEPATAIRPIYLRVAPADIALVKFLFESYEEVAVVRTIDRYSAVIVVLAVPDFLVAARAIVAELQQQIACCELPAAPPEADDWLMRAIDL